jgi:site-specific DNA-methyltransferase (adenine-specific)
MSVELILGDCLQVMRTLEAGSVDAVITDPPYGTTQLSFDKVGIDWASYWSATFEAIHDRATVAMFAQQPFATDLIVSNRKYFRYELIWCKTMGQGFLSANKQPLRAHENILIFTPTFPDNKKGAKTTTYNPQWWYDRPYTRKHPRGIRHYNHPLDMSKPTEHADGRRYPLSWQIVSNGNNNNVHPTQKPLELVEYLVKMYTNPGDTVLDPFMGSGTTAVACVQAGRNFIGIEIDPVYFATAQRRIEAAQAQPALVGVGE